MPFEEQPGAVRSTAANDPVGAHSRTSTTTSIPGLHLLVRFRPGSTDAERAAALYVVGGWVERAIPGLDIVRVALPGDANDAFADGAAVAATLAAQLAVERAELDPTARLVFDPNDQYYRNDPFTGQGQWGIRKAQVNKAWDTTRGSPATVIAVLDTGVDAGHPDLAAALVPGATFVTEPSIGCDVPTTVKDDNSHGTHVAGIAGALGNNKVGVAGVAFGVKVMPVKVLDCTGSGFGSDIAQGIRYAVDNGARIVSLSLGTPEDSFALSEAVAYAVSKNVLIVTAVGNCHTSSQGCVSLDQIDYPAAYPGVLGVGATDADDDVAFFSSRNHTVDLSAPGDRIVSTTPTYATYESRNAGLPLNYAAARGTSQATPFVAGVAALVWTADPSLTAPQVIERLEATADDLGPKGLDSGYGYGRVNAARAVSFTGDRYGASYDTTALPAAAATGASFVVRVAVTNTSSFTWRAADPDAVRLSWSWTDASGGPVPGLGATLPLPSDLAPAATATVTGSATAPAAAGVYTLRLDLVRAGIAFSGKGVPAAGVAVAVGSGYGATIVPAATGASFDAGSTAQLGVTLTNTGTQPWLAAGATPVHLSYHWLQDGAALVWDGRRTALPADILPGATVTVTLAIDAPPQPGIYVLRLELVREGVAWFADLGVQPRDIPAEVHSGYVATYSVPALPILLPGGRAHVPVRVTNTGTATWSAGGATPVHLASHVVDATGVAVVWDGPRTVLAADVAPGASVTADVVVDAPLAAGPYRVRVDLVREGVAWFSGLGVATGDTDLLVVDDFRASVPGGPLVLAGPATVTEITVTNTGIATWTTDGPAPVDLAVHYYDASGVLLLWDGPRTALGGSVAPGKSATVTVQVGPIPAGTAFVTVDLVAEGVAWFGAGPRRPLTLAP